MPLPPPMALPASVDSRHPHPGRGHKLPPGTRLAWPQCSMAWSPTGGSLLAGAPLRSMGLWRLIDVASRR